MLHFAANATLSNVRNSRRGGDVDYCTNTRVKYRSSTDVLGKPMAYCVCGEEGARATYRKDDGRGDQHLGIQTRCPLRLLRSPWQ